jgi:DNA-binding response OmpR family regulator
VRVTHGTSYGYAFSNRLDREALLQAAEAASAALREGEAGSVVDLRTLEFELLAELAREAGRVVPRDRLLERVWGLSFAGGTRTVDVHVAQLRKKLGRRHLIKTVRGVGYRLLET